MTRNFPEPDWKRLSKLRPIALERFCERVLEQTGAIASEPKPALDRYKATYAFILEQDRELAICFDDVRRSTAYMRLAAMRVRNMVTDQEFAEFSDDTQAAINLICGMFDRK